MYVPICPDKHSNSNGNPPKNVLKKIKEKENWDYTKKDKSFFDNVQLIFPEGPFVKFIYPDNYSVVRSYGSYTPLFVTGKMIREAYYGIDTSKNGTNSNNSYVVPMINPSLIRVPAFSPSLIPAFGF